MFTAFPWEHGILIGLQVTVPDLKLAEVVDFPLIVKKIGLVALINWGQEAGGSGVLSGSEWRIISKKLDVFILCLSHNKVFDASSNENLEI